jgi:hypothetical protein
MNHGGSDRDNYVSVLLTRLDGDDAHGSLRFLLRVWRLWLGLETEARRLLRLLFVRRQSVPICAGFDRLPGRLTRRTDAAMTVSRVLASERMILIQQAFRLEWLTVAWM